MQKSLPFNDSDVFRRARIRRTTNAVGSTIQMVAVAKNPTCPGNSIGMVGEVMLSGLSKRTW